MAGKKRNVIRVCISLFMSIFAGEVLLPGVRHNSKYNLTTI